MTKATGRKVARVFDGAGSYVRVGGVTTAARSIAFAQPRPVVAAAWPDTEREFEVRFFEPERPLSGDCDVAEGSIAAFENTTAVGPEADVRTGPSVHYPAITPSRRT
jgi:hypothetical protein